MGYKALLQKRADLLGEQKQLLAKLATAKPEARAALTQRDDAIVAELATINADVARFERAFEEERRATAAVVPAGRVVVEEAADFKSLGEQLQAIAHASTPGGSIDPRLAAPRADTPTGGSAASPSDGGYAIRPQFMADMLNRAIETSVLAQACDRVGIGEGQDRLEVVTVDETSRATGSRWGGVRVYRAAEAATVESSRPKIDRQETRLEDLRGIAYMTERQIEDAGAMQQVYSNAFASEFAFVVDDEIVRGDGVGRCLGLLNSAALVTVAKETGQAAATVVTDNLSKMWNRLHPRSRGNAAWYINSDVEPQLDHLAIPVGTGALEPRYITWGPDGVLRIKGRPVQVVEQCESVGTVGDIILADLSQYVLVDKGQLQGQSSMHVRFLHWEMAFRWQVRINGQPKWKSALTPYKGSASQSPFVALATRA